jgi:hypothetical protein
MVRPPDFQSGNASSILVRSTKAVVAEIDAIGQILGILGVTTDYANPDERMYFHVSGIPMTIHAGN